MTVISSEIDVSNYNPTETLVFRGLEAHGPMTFSRIVKWTGRGSSSVDRALRQLESDGVIECYRTKDLRERKYDLKDNE